MGIAYDVAAMAAQPRQSYPPDEGDRVRDDGGGADDLVPILDDDDQPSRLERGGVGDFGSAYLDRRVPDDVIPDAPPPKPEKARRSDSVGPAGEDVLSPIGGPDYGEYDLAGGGEEDEGQSRRRAVAAKKAAEPKVVRDDRTCRTCGYQLIGLPLDGRCPECGTPVAASGDSDRLDHASGEWLDRLALGCRLMLWGVFGGTALLALLSAAIALGLMPDNAMLVASAAFAGSLAVLAGAVLVTWPDPSGRGEGEYGGRRKAIRVLAGFGLAAAAAEAATALPGLTQPTAASLGVAATVLGIPWVLVHAVTASLLRQLAIRGDEPYLRDRAETCTWTIAGTLAAFAFLLGTMFVLSFLRAGQAAGGGAVAPGFGAGIFCSRCTSGVVGLLFVAAMVNYLVLLEQMAQLFLHSRRAGDARAAGQSDRPPREAFKVVRRPRTKRF